MYSGSSPCISSRCFPTSGSDQTHGKHESDPREKGHPDHDHSPYWNLVCCEVTFDVLVVLLRYVNAATDQVMNNARHGAGGEN